MENFSQNDDTWKHLFNGLDPLVVTFLPVIASFKNKKTPQELHFTFNIAKSEIKSMAFKPQVVSHAIKLIQFWMLVNMKSVQTSPADEKQFLQLLHISSMKEEFSHTSSLAYLLCQLHTPSDEHLDFYQAVTALLSKTHKPSKLISKPFKINMLLSIQSRMFVLVIGFVSSLISLYYFSSARFLL